MIAFILSPNIYLKMRVANNFCFNFHCNIKNPLYLAPRKFIV